MLAPDSDEAAAASASIDAGTTPFTATVNPAPAPAPAAPETGLGDLAGRRVTLAPCPEGGIGDHDELHQGPVVLLVAAVPGWQEHQGHREAPPAFSEIA